MKEFVDKISLTDVLGHLFPGSIALWALLFWDLPSPDRIVGSAIGSNTVLTGLLGVVFAYALGLIVAMWSAAGARAAKDVVAPLNGTGTGTWPEWIQHGRRFIWWKLTRIVAGLPNHGTAVILGYNDVQAVVERLYERGAPLLLAEPGDQMLVFRAIVSGRFKDQANPIAIEADILKRRFMFAIGTALSLAILAGSTGLRAMLELATRLDNLRPAGVASRWAIAIPGIATAVLLSVFLFAGRHAIAHSAGKKKIVAAGTMTGLFGIGADIWLQSSGSGTEGILAVFLPGAAALFLVAICLTLCHHMRDEQAVGRPLAVVYFSAVAALLAVVLGRVSAGWMRGLIGPVPGDPVLLLVIAFVAAYTSRKLRRVAAECEERELAHTLALVRLFGHHF